MGGVIFDKHGNLYGAAGGGSDSCPSTGDCGVVYQLSPSKQQRGAWIESVLYTFKGYNQGDGATPGGGLILEPAGNLYGVTAYGGTGKCAVLGTTMGCGSVFRLRRQRLTAELDRKSAVQLSRGQGWPVSRRRLGV